MSSNEPLNINLRSLPREGLNVETTLNGSFFRHLDQQEITDGHVAATISVRESAGSLFRIHIKAEGSVIVPCDCCLDDLEIPVEAEDTLQVAYEDELPEPTDEVTAIPASQVAYDLSWDIYETILLALPLQRKHRSGECNEDVAKYIAGPDE